MVSRSFASVVMATALVVLGTTALLQVGVTGPAGAAGSTVELFAWGDNSTGELGNGTTISSPTPITVLLPSGVTATAVAGGGGQGDPQPSQYAGYAIGSDGHLYAWGDNSQGALGDGNNTSSSTPVRVSLPSGVIPKAIAAAQGAGYAIGSDGHLYAWGANPYGTLGNGTSGDFSDTPVVVSLPSGVTPTAIAGGFETAYAIGSDRHLYAWGDNTFGELGDGSTTSSSTPVEVSLPSGLMPEVVAGGGGTGYAIGSDGNLYAWGLNTWGQLGNGTTGNGTTTISDTPVVVALPSGVVPRSIAGAGQSAYAIGSDRNLYAWGIGSSGQLGTGNFFSSSTPIVVALPSGVTATAISGGYDTAYANGSDGHLYAWGGNAQGQLGNNGTTGVDSTPAMVPLPPGSTAESLGPEPGSLSGYAIASVPSSNTLTIATTSLPPGTVGVPYSVQLEAVGGAPPYSWNKYLPKGMGKLPLGVILSKSGLISGTPKRAGTYTFTVKCLDASRSHKTQATQALTLTINP